MCNHNLPIEKRHLLNIDRNDRKCNLCQLNDVADEYHYLLKCPHFIHTRKRLIPSVQENNVNSIMYKKLMNETDERKLISLAKYIKLVLDHFRTTPG